MAYAAVISLKHNIKHLIDPAIDQNDIETVFNTLVYLKGVLQRLDIKSNKSYDMDAIKALDAEIRKAVWKLEDAFESNHSLPQMIRSFNGTAHTLGWEFETLLRHPLDGEDQDEDEGVSPIPDSGGNKLLQSTTIGLSEDQFQKINKELVDAQTGIKTVLLAGMAGIGKTHFARQIYQHPRIVKFFNITAWVRVGRKRGVKDILVDIVAQIEQKPRNLYVNKNMYTLSMLLGKKLGGVRCLIVLDDIWSEPDCHVIISRLKEAGVRRVLLTTRLQHIINENKQSTIHQMRFMNNEESWSLLWQNVFVDEKSFPPQLEKAGRKIAANCEGLPLLILVVARLLRGADKTQEYWNKVADKKTSTFVDAYDMISNVLMSSYEYLSEQLKACFLYMGVFPQSSEIPLSKLINLLTVEDFLEPNEPHQILEDFGAECVEKLVSNSLVIVCKQGYYNYRMNSCKLHSAYWYLCIKEARKNKFFHVLNTLTDGSEEYIESQRRLSVQNNILFGIKEVHESMAGASTARSLLCTGKDHEYPVPICLNLMLLRVLDALSIRLYEFPEEVVKLLLLRYLALTHNGKLPCSISNLRRLQFLIISQHHNIIKLVTGDPRDSTFLPTEIWDMQQLKHLRMMGHNLPDPSNFDSKLPNLETLYVNAHSCTEAVFRSLPNLKKLGIAIELQPNDEAGSSCFEHIELLHKLESLKCVVVNPWRRSHGVVPPYHLKCLPRGLKKVSLNGLGYSWDYMREIASLPYLKVLKLRCSAFQGPEWTMRRGDFSSLEFLLLEDIDLVKWRAAEGDYGWATYSFDGFQHLQCLTLRHCYKLETIDPRFEWCLTLKTVEVVDCSPSVVAVAKRIHDFNNSFEVVINSSWTKGQ